MKRGRSLHAAPGFTLARPPTKKKNFANLLTGRFLSRKLHDKDSWIRQDLERMFPELKQGGSTK